MARATHKTIEAVGFSVLGLGFWFQAARSFGFLGPPADEAPVPVGRLAGLGQSAEAAALQQSKGVFSHTSLHTVNDIKERVAFIQERVRKDSLSPTIKEKALAVLTRKVYEDSREPFKGAGDDGRKVVWAVPPKDFEAEIVALFTAVQDPKSDVALRYTRDHIEVDQYTSADKLLKLPGGDCDDGTILLGALLRSVGYPVRMRVIQDTNSKTWSHIYLLVGTPPMRPDKWIPLDWSVIPYKPAGWEAPGSKEVARTGKPSGVVTRLMDFSV